VGPFKTLEASGSWLRTEDLLILYGRGGGIRTLDLPIFLVGAAGFELATSRTQTGRATRLRYAPIRKMPAIEGVRSRSAFRWLHWSPRSLQDHASPQNRRATRLRYAPILVENGGAEGARTPDPLHAMQVLSHLSYSPIMYQRQLAGTRRSPHVFLMVGVTGLEPTTSASRTRRSTRLSYTPLRRISPPQPMMRKRIADRN
jgi:hypothetical protein